MKDGDIVWDDDIDGDWDIAIVGILMRIYLRAMQVEQTRWTGEGRRRRRGRGAARRLL